MQRKLRYVTGIVLGAGLFIVAAAADTETSTKSDGLYYFNAMRDSMKEVIKENQELINTTPDGKAKSESLTPAAQYRTAYANFKKVMGADFSPKSLKGEYDSEKIAHVLATMLQGGRGAIAKSQKEINTDADGSVTLKKFIPAVYGKLVGERMEQKTGIKMKQTTLGKNGYGARNPYNAPDEWETQSLNQIMTTDWPRNQGVGEQNGAGFRYVKPIYIKQACLGCHGSPKGEVGGYGHPKEGYEVGDVRGGISVTIPGTG